MVYQVGEKEIPSSNQYKRIENDHRKSCQVDSEKEIKKQTCPPGRNESVRNSGFTLLEKPN